MFYIVRDIYVCNFSSYYVWNIRLMLINLLSCEFSSMVIDNRAAEIAPAIAPNSGMSSMSEMPVSPTSVASTGHFPFSASDISGMGVDTSALDTAFTSDALPPDNGAGNSRDSLRSLAQITWNFSLSDLTADLSNLGGMYIIL